MGSLKNRSIVVIDDTPSILVFLRASLEAMGAECHEAQTASGGEALCEHVKPDVVILDLGLPDKEGFNILPRIKRMNKDPRLPIVVVLTVRSEQRYRDIAKELGADAYITKPFSVDHLIDVINEKLNVVSAGVLSQMAYTT